MDDEKLSELFAEYNPELASDSLFINRLEHNLEAVELVKAQMEKVRSKSRLAIIVAALTGFISGILSVLAYPFIKQTFATIVTAGAKLSPLPSIYSNVVVWSVIAAVVCAMTYTAYDITLTISKKSLQPMRLSH